MSNGAHHLRILWMKVMPEEVKLLLLVWIPANLE